MNNLMSEKSVERYGSVASIVGLAVGVMGIIFSVIALFVTNWKVAGISVIVISSILILFSLSWYLRKSLHHILQKSIRDVDWSKSNLQRVEEIIKEEPGFERTGDSDFFINILKEENVESIDIIGHTGEQLIKNLFDSLDENPDIKEKVEKIRIRILIRSPYYEVGERAMGISRTVQKYIAHHNNDIALHFYQNLPMFRAIICRSNHSGNVTRKAYISFYHFPEPGNPSKSHKNAFIIDEKKYRNHKLIEIAENWFNHYWGKSESEKHIHTIILDFDDTIVSSHSIQIDAWVDTVLEALSKNKNALSEGQLTPYIQEALNDRNKLTKRIARIFYEKQDAKKIFPEIFKDVDAENKDIIQNRRFEIRKNKMAETDINFSPGFEDILKNLAKNYHLIIVSATDEAIIRGFLKKNNMLDNFRYIFGKREPVFNWKDTARKSQLLHKVVNILGVPLEHMVYVGDNNGDFLASTAIGADYIEARCFASQVRASIGKDSLVFDAEDEPVHFNHWNNFLDALGRIERKKENKLESISEIQYNC
jgi:phosphoglycolate phosphatase-like HAD superfamily hydrolase